MTIIIIAALTVLFTMLGGMFALRFKDKLHLIMGFSAGAILAVAFFDLLPEAIELGGESYEAHVITGVVAFGFLFYLTLDRFFLLHTHDDDGDHDTHHHRRGNLGAGSLTLHSFLDGAAIGLAFQVSDSVGWILASAVLAHKFSDGVNTVNLILKNKGTSSQAIRWLITSSLAPALGACSAFFFTLPASSLALILAVFCGFFLYIGASDLLPESHHAHPTRYTTLATLLGAATLYIAILALH